MRLSASIFKLSFQDLIIHALRTRNDWRDDLCPSCIIIRSPLIWSNLNQRIIFEAEVSVIEIPALCNFRHRFEKIEFICLLKK